MGCAGSTAKVASASTKKKDKNNIYISEDEEEESGEPFALSPQNSFQISYVLEENNSMDQLRGYMSLASFVRLGLQPQIFEYEFSECIGRGAHAEVFLAYNTQNGENYAAKVYNKASILKPQFGEMEEPFVKVLREIQIMAMVKHDFCVQLQEVLDDEQTQTLIIILTYAKKGPLFPDDNILHPIKEDLARHYFKQISEGLQHLHSKNIIHRDIKPQNILITEENNALVADFSVSLVLSDENELLEDTQGTPMYYSPEECSGEPYLGKPADIWSLGITLYVMIYGTMPFKSSDSDGSYLSYFYKVALMIQSSPIAYNPAIPISASLRNLLEGMLAKNVDDRLTIDEIIEHPWVLGDPFYC